MRSTRVRAPRSTRARVAAATALVTLMLAWPSPHTVLAADGDLDATFDGDGKVTTDSGGQDRAFAVAVQPDGKIVVAGNSQPAGGRQFGLARYNVDGSLDTSFGGTGLVQTSS